MNEKLCSPAGKNIFLDLRERILTYEPKKKEKMRKLLSEIDEKTLITSILDIITANPCESFYIVTFLNRVSDILPSQFTKEALITAIAENGSMELAVFTQIWSAKRKIFKSFRANT